MDNENDKVINKHGEVVNEIRPGDRIVRAKSLDCLIDTVELNKGKEFIKVYPKMMFEVSKKLSGVESQMLNYLIQYIGYQTGILTFSNGRALTRSHIAQETEQDVKTVDKIMSSLIKKQVLGKHKSGKKVCFLANPFIFMKGNRVNKTLVKLFVDTEWAKTAKRGV